MVSRHGASLLIYRSDARRAFVWLRHLRCEGVDDADDKHENKIALIEFHHWYSFKIQFVAEIKYMTHFVSRAKWWLILGMACGWAVRHTRRLTRRCGQAWWRNIFDAACHIAMLNGGHAANGPKPLSRRRWSTVFGRRVTNSRASMRFNIDSDERALSGNVLFIMVIAAKLKKRSKASFGGCIRNIIIMHVSNGVYRHWRPSCLMINIVVAIVQFVSARMVKYHSHKSRPCLIMTWLQMQQAVTYMTHQNIARYSTTRI